MSLPDGPLGVAIQVGILVPVICASYAYSAAKKTHKIVKKTIKLEKRIINLYDYLNPTIFEDRISILTAKIKYTAAIRSNQTISQYYALRGKYYWLQGKMEAAMADFADACQVDDTNADAFYSTGLLLMSICGYKQAIKYFVRALDALARYEAPSQAKQVVRAVEQGLGKIKTGFLHHVRDSVAKVTTLVQTEAVKSHIDEQLEKNSEFYAKLVKAENVQVTCKAIYNAKALCSYYLNDYDTALADYKTLLAHQEAVTDVTLACYWCNLAHVYFYRTEFKHALLFYNMILEKAKHVALPKKWISSVYWMRSYTNYFLHDTVKSDNDAFDAAAYGKEQPFLWKMLPTEMIASILAYTDANDRINVKNASLILVPFVDMADTMCRVKLITNVNSDNEEEHSNYAIPTFAQNAWLLKVLDKQEEQQQQDDDDAQENDAMEYEQFNA